MDDIAPPADATPRHDEAPRLRRLSLYEVVAERLREMVLEGELPPGGRISEKKLCETFEVSRTPLREALKVLANEGIIELLPNRGAKVTEVEPREVADLFEVMVELEGLSGRLLASRADEVAIAEIRDLHDRMMAHYRQQERQDYFALNQRLHRRLTEIAGNRVLLELEASLTVKVTRARYAANLQLGRWEESAREHQAILEALERRDGEGLARAMREHMRRTGEAVIQGLVDG
ncbi:GntR family transcriptional regulator [Halomonas beimenensis]|uniref:Transcriptional regulator, GntR family n=1 Tax=Halomonas beimenensis TaxID=475662 RepID=A0A291PAU5_9GAMM|nr:GntR family transcriptional regulator [Halomonas beimenensis]ATJ84007.1 transcriptional regulator, GntR family [Halomonas beimenensis]